MAFSLFQAEGSQYGRLWEGSGPIPTPVPVPIPVPAPAPVPTPPRITHQKRVTAEQFIFHKVLGKGSFGKVG